MELLFHNSKFEREVRKRLNVFDRAITDADAQLITELSLTSFSFQDEDIDTLMRFNGLKTLAIEIENKDSCFWNHFPQLEDLYWIASNDSIDFSTFSNMTNLVQLTVSGGDYSSIAFENLEALIPLPKLNYLELHEFGLVDLAPLENMKQLKFLAVRYSHKVKNISTIGTMVQLERLELDGLCVDNLDFLDTLPDSVELEMCGIEIYGTKDVNISKWKRFSKHEICEIKLMDPWWEYIDLSELDK